jgi:hypothetical protein
VGQALAGRCRQGAPQGHDFNGSGYANAGLGDVGQGIRFAERSFGYSSPDSRAHTQKLTERVQIEPPSAILITVETALLDVKMTMAEEATWL